jgi:hypothetical protein
MPLAHQSRQIRVNAAFMNSMSVGHSPRYLKATQGSSGSIAWW